MGKPHPVELRQRVVKFVEDGHSRRAAAVHFRVSPRFVNRMMISKRETGSLAAKPQGRGRGGKLDGHAAWVRDRLCENGDLTLDELRLELAERGVHVHRSSVGRLLHRLGLSHKKSLQASEQHKIALIRERHLWTKRRRPFFAKALPRLIFLDETSTNTKLTKRTGWLSVANATALPLHSVHGKHRPLSPPCAVMA